MTSTAWTQLREAAALVCSYDQSKYKGAVLGATLAVNLLREALKRVDAEPQQPDEARERAIEAWLRRARAVKEGDGRYYMDPLEIDEAVALMRSAPASDRLGEGGAS